jgi:hypothetical protein
LNPNRWVIDETLGAGKLWGRLMSQVVGKEGIPFRLFKAWFEGVPSRISFVWPVLFLVFLIGISKYGRANRFLARCPMCGSPTYRFYLRTTDQDFICFNCHSLYSEEKLHPRIAEKSVQVRNFKENQFSAVFHLLRWVCLCLGRSASEGAPAPQPFHLHPEIRLLEWVIPSSLATLVPLSLVSGVAFSSLYLLSFERPEWKGVGTEK